MTTSTRNHGASQGAPGWIVWLIGIALIIMFIWLFNIAGSARSTAEANRQLLSQPQLEINFVAGGPTRFPDEFAEAVEDAELEEFDSESMLWSTALVSNAGIAEADDARLSANFQSGLTPTVIASLPSFGPSFEATANEGTLEADLSDIGDDERAYIFFGFQPDALTDEHAQNWAQNYQSVMGSLTVETDEISETVYGRWL